MSIVSGDMTRLKAAAVEDLLEGGMAPTELQIADGVNKSSFPGLSAVRSWLAPVSR